jgi:hypothetical protein
MKNLLLMLGIILLTGCGSMTTITKPVEKLPLKLTRPVPLVMRPVKFVVITKESAGAVFAEMESQGLQPVLFGLSGADYKALAINIKDIQNFIATQNQIIILYKSYYEPE